MDKDLLKLLETEAGSLATVNECGEPNQATVAGLQTRDGKILITDIHLGSTVQNIQNNPKVSLAIWARNWEENCLGFMINGEAKYLQSGEDFEFIRNHEMNEGENVKGVIVLNPLKIKKYAE